MCWDARLLQGSYQLRGLTQWVGGGCQRRAVRVGVH
jgi:hypothetical protein